MTTRCDECVLIGAAGAALEPDELQRRLQRCDDCPQLAAMSPEARAIAGRLTDALARANRVARRTASKLSQRERECTDLEAAIAGHEERLAQIENIQIAGARAADRELEARLEQIERQHREIASLSTPCIQVWDGVLVLPLIGAFDDVRAEVLRETVLTAIPRYRARSVILDLTGVADIDRATVGHLFTIAAAIRLLGATPILVGLAAQVAVTIVQLGLPAPTFTVMRDLREAIAAVVRGA
jgi:anti-anti-sigma regulatory factor